MGVVKEYQRGNFYLSQLVAGLCTFAMLIPSISMEPPSTSVSLNRHPIMLDFPAPVRPTIPT